MRKNQTNISLTEQLHQPFNCLNELEHLIEQSKRQPRALAESSSADDIDIDIDSQMHRHEKGRGSMALVPVSKKTLAATASAVQSCFGGLSHPIFTQQQTPINPDRPLDEVTKPVPRHHERLQHLLQTATPANKAIASKSQSVTGYHDIYSDASSTDNIHRDSVDEASKFQQASPWALIASPDLASHLELLEAGGLIALPPKFFEPVAYCEPVANNEAAHSAAVDKASSSVPKAIAMEATHSAISKKAAVSSVVSPIDSNNRSSEPALRVHKSQYSKALLLPLTEMTLLDLSDIYPICLQYPTLTRYGFKESTVTDKRVSKQAAKRTASSQAVHGQSLAAAIPEIINDIFSPNWEVILYPERFDNGVDSLAIDILACSAAVHILKQCLTRQTVNRSLTAQQICQHMRSYVLSQCNQHPQFESTYRQIRLFAGHVVFAAAYLGLKVSYSPRPLLIAPIAEDEQRQVQEEQLVGQPIYINVAARAALFTRYPNISRYYINGWS